MYDTQNIIVSAIFAVSLTAVVAGCLFARRSSGSASRKAGSLTVAAVAGSPG